MSRYFGFFLIAIVAAPALADSVMVTMTGNFGAPTGGSSVFDNQNYTLNFLIPDTTSPSATTCCLDNISATYDVNAILLVPGIGLSSYDAVRVQYNDEAPLGEWLNVSNFIGLPVGNFMLLTPFQINSGQLWNGLAGALGTPTITSLDDTAGSGIWRLEQDGSMGPIPLAEYPNGAATITVSDVPEAVPVYLLGAALFALGLFRRRTAHPVPSHDRGR